MNALVLDPTFLLRTFGLLFSMQGDVGASRTFMKMADAAAAGRNIDAHLQTVADALKAGVTPDWNDVLGRIESKTESILGA